MPLILVLEALGGLGLFVLGMKTLSGGLQRLASQPLRRFLDKYAGNRITSPLIGAFCAYLLQSSGAASILVIGFVNAGLVTLYQALAILLGTGIGTSISIQLFAFKTPFLALPAIFAGVFLKFYASRRNTSYLGEIILGLGLLFFGLETMETYSAPLREKAIFGAYDVIASSPICSVFLGALLTFLLQSGRTAIGIVIALAMNGLLTAQTGMAMVLGEALGTSAITAIGAIGGTSAAKRTVAAYFALQCAAVGAVILLFPFFNRLVRLFPLHTPHDAAHDIANAHMIFTAIVIIVFLPLLGFIARWAMSVFPGKEAKVNIEPSTRFLDMRVIDTPSIAFSQAESEVHRMGEVAHSMFMDVTALFQRFNARTAQRIRQKEELLDLLQRDISTFLIAIARQPQTTEISPRIPYVLQTVGNFESIGDKTEAILNCLTRKKENRIFFSETAMLELKGISGKVSEIIVTALASQQAASEETMDKAAILWEDVDDLQETIKINHLKRLSAGKCSVTAGLIYMDIVNSFVKIAESAYAILERNRKDHP